MTALIVIFLVVLWLLWLTSKPGQIPLVSEADRAKLAGCMEARPSVGDSTGREENAPSHTHETGKSLLQVEQTTDNLIDTYPDFHPMVKQLLEDIGTAEHFIHVQFFKFEADAIGQCIGDALIAKAKQGIEVRLLYDDMANMKSKWYYKKLQREGIEVCGFGPAYIPFLRKKDNYRNHRKVVVIDGKKGYLGGMNIADRYYQGLRWGNWRDTQIRLQGPAVGELQLAFLCDWRYASGKLLADKKYFPKVEGLGDLPVRVLTSGPIGEGPTIMKELCRILDTSQQYVYWESPYFIPTREVMQSICRAARRGVNVRIIIPPRGDRGILTPLASKSYLSEVLEAGADIYFYSKGYMHSKIVACDDRIATIGSTNIDPRSYLLDLEINAFIEDEKYTRTIKEIFLADEKDSEHITKEQWAERPCRQRLFEHIARLFSAQL